jgi:hypothetical protein
LAKNTHQTRLKLQVLLHRQSKESKTSNNHSKSKYTVYNETLKSEDSHDSPDQNKYNYGESEVVGLVIQKIVDDSIPPFLKILKIWYLKSCRLEEKIVQTP